MELFEPTGPKARVEQLLREAQLQRMREQWSAAEMLCREALEIEPEEPQGLEMLGDLQVGKGNLDGALEHYRKALEMQPQRAALEEKIAHLVLLKDQEERDKIAAQLLLDCPPSKSERKRFTAVAVLLSVVFPGGGQLLMGQYVKGGVLMAVFAIGMFLGIPDLYKLLGALSAAPGSHAPVVHPNPLFAMLGMLSVVVWFYSLLDASSQAGKSSRKGIE